MSRVKLKSIDWHKNRVGSLIVIVAGAAFIFATGYLAGAGGFSLPLPNRNGSVQKKLPENLDYSSVERVYDSLRANYDGEVKLEQLLDGLKDGLAQSTGDPYTEYLSEEEAQDFEEELSGSFTGIGAQLIEKDNLITIEVPLAGYPAEKVGLKARDIILEINGESAYDLDLNEAVKKIRGAEGTKVKLRVLRDSKDQLDFEITRVKITIPSIESKILEGNIGYLKVSRFGTDTADLAREAAENYQKANVKGVILDLRNNPGGLLDSAVSLSGLWLKKGEKVLEEKRGGRTIKTYQASGRPVLGNIPTIVLINEGSASASEITAGALKDNGYAKLVGTKSYGKGSVQQVICMDPPLFGENCSGAELKVTIARWFTPKGKNIDKEGIEPDEKVERTEEDFEAEKDPQLDKALEILKK